TLRFLLGCRRLLSEPLLLRRAGTPLRLLAVSAWASRHLAGRSPGGAEGSRTPDLVIANDALYQLSYGPDRQAGAGNRRDNGGVSTGRARILGDRRPGR